MADNNAGTGRGDDNPSDVIHVGAVDYESVSDDYLDKRQLKKGAAGWILLAGLGVSYVISGDFAGWKRSEITALHRMLERLKNDLDEARN